MEIKAKERWRVVLHSPLPHPFPEAMNTIDKGLETTHPVDFSGKYPTAVNFRISTHLYLLDSNSLLRAY